MWTHAKNLGVALDSFSLVEKNESVDLRKNWKILFEPSLRIVTWEEHLRKL